MKIIELIEELKSYSKITFSEDNTCDTVKIGDAQREIKKVAVSMFATPEVIRKAADFGANFLIVHEPMCYDHLDRVVPYEIGNEKKALINEKGICVFRFHDNAHGMEPDLIYEGQIFYSKLKGKCVKGKYFAVNNFVLDEPMTAMELARHLENELNLKHIRIAGCTDKKGTKIGCCFGTPGHIVEELMENDFVLTGELCEWKDGEVARDYAQLGYNKAFLVMGHIGSERGGMRLLAEKLSKTHPEFETKYIECGEVYSYTD